MFTEIFGLLLLFLRKMKYKPVFFLFYSAFLCIHLTFSFYFQRNFSMIDVHIFFFLLVFLLWASLVFIHLFTVCLANFYSFMLFVNATLLQSWCLLLFYCYKFDLRERHAEATTSFCDCFSIQLLFHLPFLRGAMLGYWSPGTSPPTLTQRGR